MNKALNNFFVLAVVGLALVTAGCLKSPFASQDDEENNKPEPAIPVEVAPIETGSIEALVRTTTHLEAEAEVKVFARTANRVTDLLVEEGDQVALDQVLLQLEDDIQTVQFEKAQSNLEKTQDEFTRSQALYDQNLISDQAFLEIKHLLRQHELALEDAQRELEYTQVRAPIAGTVTRRLVKEGDLVNISQHLFDLVDFNSIVARIYIPERELQRLRVDQPARVTSTALAGRETPGYVQRIAPIVESKTGTVKVTVAFPEVGPLLPGMYVDVEIVTAKRDDALLLTKRALVYDGDQIFAYRLLTNRVVERILVQPRIVDRDNLEPREGFQAGDLIVVAGQTGLKDGAKVRLPGDPDPEEESDDSEETEATVEADTDETSDSSDTVAEARASAA